MTTTNEIRTQKNIFFFSNGTLEVCFITVSLCFCFVFLVVELHHQCVKTAELVFFFCFFFVRDLPIQKSFQGLFLQACEQNFSSALLCSAPLCLPAVWQVRNNNVILLPWRPLYLPVEPAA